jgi:hypothetical protein
MALTHFSRPCGEFSAGLSQSFCPTWLALLTTFQQDNANQHYNCYADEIQSSRCYHDPVFYFRLASDQPLIPERTGELEELPDSKNLSSRATVEDMLFGLIDNCTDRII